MRNASQRSIVFLLTLTLGAILHQSRAEAKCARAQENWSLSAGEEIPARATLFYFAPNWTDAQTPPMVRADSVAIASEWKQVSKNEAFTTFRLRFDAGQAKSIHISKDGSSQRYSVTAWTAPKEGRVSGSIGTREQSAWTCSHTDIVPVKVKSQAQAFRVAWFDVRNGVIDFGSGSSIFPRSANRFWRNGADNKSQAHASFELGHSNCFGYNVPSKNLDAMQITVTPLYRDGSEGKAALLKPGKRNKQPEAPYAEEPVVPTTSVPMARPAPMVQVQTQETLPQPFTSEVLVLKRSANAASHVSLRLVGIALLLGTLFGLLIFRSHRRGVSTPRLVGTGTIVSLACGALAWAATLVCFPFWLLFAAGGLALLYGAARYLEVDG